MSDKLTTYPIDKLLRWILNEEKSGQILGIARELFFTPAEGDPFRMRRYGQTLETPVGVAAGPHTQLTQNIIAAWLCGAHYIELKTVQVLDHIEVSKPCIDMEDEGYNCEWSQELTVDESFNQYLDAWILIHVLRHHFGRDAQEAGVILNMSVGYDMQGILSEKIQRFLDRMADCHVEKANKIKSLADLYPAIADIPIPDCISDNVTLSTMHGCPADEIEQIGRYLIEERGLHTTIKLNPTLLGKQELRRILNQELHYDVVVPNEAFERDLKYADARGIIRRLGESADKKGVSFGLKLTNTLETVNARNVLPESENMVYMSGRALHPISVALAAKLQTDFDGALDISFSAGADCFNTPWLIAGGLAPVTVCSDLLKPGGYARLAQYLDELSSAMNAVDAQSIAEFITAKSPSRADDVKTAALHNLTAYAERVRSDEVYSKDFLPFKSIKTPRELRAFDCIHAPCVETCPAQQAVPEYMFHTARGDDAAAFNVVMETNPFPNVTGMVCDHSCQTKCTRQNIDAPLRIRDIKRFISEQPCEPELTPAPPNGLRAAIIGAGPSGLSCAWFLALAGFEVSVYEAKETPGGMLADAIPR
ncbi:MAG: NAD(P)-binding protein, partial [Calditrichaeota bacterium]|nr:NAD(P)-binding protein [Calditrichota bacterium]